MVFYTKENDMEIQVPEKLTKRIVPEGAKSYYGKGIVRQDFRHPRSGKTIDFYMFDNGGIVPVIIFPFTAAGNVLVLRQYRHAADDILWELPGGTPEYPGEAELVIADRELLEETGFRARGLIQLVPRVWFDPCSVTVPFVPYLALDCFFVQEAKHEETEEIELHELKLSHWLSLVRKGEVVDSKTLTTTFLALPHLRTIIEE